jgi:pimeloyl-ACP methyl ester carboxylesterase
MASKKDDGMSRRQFAALTAGTALAGALASNAMAQTTAAHTAAHTAAPLDLAEWSYFWVNVERAELARGTVVNGKQMYVESLIPSRVTHPYPIVMVHGGGGQGLDWMGAPDGRPGWATLLAEAGYKVYIVDRPGHGRSPFHPDLDGAWPRTATTYAGVERQFSAPEKAEKPYGPQAKLHTQWPGTGVLGDPSLDQVAAGQGGSFLQDLEETHNVWRSGLAQIFDKIGPAIIMTHSMGGPSGWIAGDVRPNLVKGIIGVEPGGPPFGNFKWGLTASKVTYDPPAADPSELRTKQIASNETYAQPCFVQEEPARQLVNLKNIPIAVVTSEASYHVPYDWGSVAFLRQAGCTVDHIKLVDHGIHGNAHFMMMEKNNREVLQVILDWIPKNVEKSAPVPASKPNETAVNLADFGFFWVGVEHKKMEYGTIPAGQMYIQYLIPQQVRHPYGVVLVHGGGAQMLHYMGTGGGAAGWAHYFAQEGYRVYLVDRPGQGRAPYHPDALGPMGYAPTYAGVANDIRRSATGPHPQWPGTGLAGDPMLDQLLAQQNAAPLDNVMAHTLWASRGAELLDKIGPSIVLVHSAAGPFGWLAANERPNLVKAIVNIEGFGNAFAGGAAWGLTDIPVAYDPPVTDPSQLATLDVKPPAGSPVQPYKLQADPPRKLKNLQGIPIVLVSADRSGRTQGPAAAAFLKQAGCTVDELPLRDKGILGNGHMMMIENNRRQVFDAIRGWIEEKA